jgi:putative RecB family exonuclease
VIQATNSNQLGDTTTGTPKTRPRVTPPRQLLARGAAEEVVLSEAATTRWYVHTVARLARNVSGDAYPSKMVTPTFTTEPALAIETAGEVVEVEAPRLWSLSPSRAGDFMTCPLLYRLRAVDRLPEPADPLATRGTLVHSVLERLFDEPAPLRTVERAADLLGPAWESLLAERPELAELFGDEAPMSFDSWLASARVLLQTYFNLEDPRRLEPAQREVLVEVELPDGVRLRGFIDRVDVAATGQTRIVDYKTGKAPSELFEDKALFQLKFYALVLWRQSGSIPTVLQLLYLGDGQILRYSPDEADLLATERKVRALWAAIERALAAKEFPARASRLCGWCSHQALCPEFGGTPPPYPLP